MEQRQSPSPNRPKLAGEVSDARRRLAIAARAAAKPNRFKNGGRSLSPGRRNAANSLAAKGEALRRGATASETESSAETAAERRRRIRQNSIYLLPNSFTIASLLMGFFAITQAFNGYYVKAAFLIFVSMALDGMDGRVARLTNSQSSFGEQLDSLADMVAFGVAPALVAYMWQLSGLGKVGYAVAFVYCACTALRLALFNTLIGKVPKKWFIGVPSPTAAGLIASFIFVSRRYELQNADVLALFVTLFAGVSMIAHVKFYSFKDIGPLKTVSFAVIVLAAIALLAVTIAPSLLIFSLFLVYSLSGYARWLYLWQKLGRRPTIAD